MPGDIPLGLGSLDAAIDLLHPYFRNLPHESLRAIFLDGNGAICGMGAWPGNEEWIELPARRILASALAADAASIILAHNHPSGDPNPSAADIQATRTFAQLCAGIGIKVLDHIIIAENRVSSMRALLLI